MIYAYNCPNCALTFDVVKVVDLIERSEHCSRCGEISTRQFFPQRLYFTGTKVEHAEYNPGLGCITRNANHRNEIAKQKGLEEIGNEAPDKIHKHFDKRREEKREEIWNKVTEGWVGNGDIDS